MILWIFIYILKTNRSINLKYNLKQDNLLLKNIMDENYILDLKSLVEFSSSLLYVSDYEKMTCLLDSSFNKNYYEYSKIIYNTICPDKFTNNKIFINNDVKLTNPFNKILFVVQDKETLLKNISNKGYVVNQGPQYWRGQINSINSFLNHLDVDYRKSLYNHSTLHYSKGNLDNSWKDETLTKKHFTFRNIHHNLGNIKW
jgi:hypothetical protein